MLYTGGGAVGWRDGYVRLFERAMTKLGDSSAPFAIQSALVGTGSEGEAWPAGRDGRDCGEGKRVLTIYPWLLTTIGCGGKGSLGGRRVGGEKKLLSGWLRDGRVGAQTWIAEGVVAAGCLGRESKVVR